MVSYVTVKLCTTVKLLGRLMYFAVVRNNTVNWIAFHVQHIMHITEASISTKN